MRIYSWFGKKVRNHKLTQSYQTGKQEKMVFMEQTNKVDVAIHAHSQWLIRLIVAIDKGTSEFKPEIVKTDNNCEFGKWLYGGFPAQQRGSVLYKEIKDLHAKFHAEAARILSLAISNQNEEAMNALVDNGEFRKISKLLINKLTDLKKVV